MPARPLVALGERLRAAAPPRLAALVEVLLVGEGFVEFMELVRQYIPEYKAEILRATGPGKRMPIFANRFRDQYFPLHWLFDHGMDDELGYDYMVHSIHTLSMGWDDDDWHSIEDRHHGHQLIFALCCDDPGLRVPTLEACAQHTDRRVLRRIPTGGYIREELHQWLDGTEYEAAAKAVDWFYGDTGNGFLDYGDELSQYAYDPWEPDTVRTLTLLWQEADLIYNQVENFRTWLEVNPNRNFGLLLDFIEARKESEGKEVVTRDPRQIPLFELPSTSSGHRFAPDTDADGG